MINIIIIGIIGHNRQTQQENNTEADILRWCEDNGRTMWEFVEMHETPAIWDHLAEVWKVMQDAIERGIDAEGVLPGRLNLPRKAASFYTKARSFKETLSRRVFTFAFALAVSEENAAGGSEVCDFPERIIDH